MTNYDKPTNIGLHFLNIFKCILVYACNSHYRYATVVPITEFPTPHEDTCFKHISDLSFTNNLDPVSPVTSAALVLAHVLVQNPHLRCASYSVN